MAAFEERRVKVRGCEIRVLTAGAGRPVVYVHGGGGLHWTRFNDVVAQHFLHYCIEMPAFGSSTITDEVKTILDVADVVAEAAKALGLTGVGWIGESLGGLTSSWVAIRHPGLISRLVLESPGGFHSPGLKPRDEMSLEEVRHALYAHPERVPAHVAAPTQQPRGFMGHLTDRRIGWEVDLRARLPELRVPTLIMNGEKDGLIGPETGREYQALIPQSWRICLDDAGHVIHLDEPDLFAELAVGFLLGQQSAPTDAAAASARETPAIR
jgi:pimeloyl-ACP methyl ester carboxylesterase